MISREELKKFLLENCVNANGHLDLRGLDFSDFDGDVIISEMTIKGNLFQSHQNVGKSLWQDHQVVEKSLFQDNQTVKEVGCKIGNIEIHNWFLKKNHDVFGLVFCSDWTYEVLKETEKAVQFKFDRAGKVSITKEIWLPKAAIVNLDEIMQEKEEIK